jgi:hypothetical protein
LFPFENHNGGRRVLKKRVQMLPQPPGFGQGLLFFSLAL